MIEDLKKIRESIEQAHRTVCDVIRNIDVKQIRSKNDLDVIEAEKELGLCGAAMRRYTKQLNSFLDTYEDIYEEHIDRLSMQYVENNWNGRAELWKSLDTACQVQHIRSINNFAGHEQALVKIIVDADSMACWELAGQMKIVMEMLKKKFQIKSWRDQHVKTEVAGEFSSFWLRCADADKLYIIGEQE